jgi:hypothetical protein
MAVKGRAPPQRRADRRSVVSAARAAGALPRERADAAGLVRPAEPLRVLWPSERAALAHANTYRGRDQRLLVFEAQSLLATHGDRTFVTTFNVGYAMRRPKPRDFSAFTPWADWSGPPRRMKEILVEGSVPDAAAHLVEVRAV